MLVHLKGALKAGRQEGGALADDGDLFNPWRNPRASGLQRDVAGANIEHGQAVVCKTDARSSIVMGPPYGGIRNIPGHGHDDLAGLTKNQRLGVLHSAPWRRSEPSALGTNAGDGARKGPSEVFGDERDRHNLIVDVEG